jgi:molybdopterin-binding protein
MVTARSGGSAPGTVTISGTAVDGSGAVLAGVTVDIAAGGVVAGIATTAANGTYSFSVASGQIAANAAVITYFADALHVGNYLDLMSSTGITGQVLKDGWLTVASGITTLSQLKAALDSAKGRLPAVNFADNYITGANVIAWRFNAPVFTIDQAFPEGNFLLDSAGTVESVKSRSLNPATPTSRGTSMPWA